LGALKKKLRLAIASEKVEGRGGSYRITGHGWGAAKEPRPS